MTGGVFIKAKENRAWDNRHSFLFWCFLFLLGATGYFGIELLFRGFSHWSMALCGGLCLCLIYAVNYKLNRTPLLIRALLGSLIITAVELASGCLLNLYLGWHIWDYSNYAIHLWGQITPTFSGLWFLLCIPVCLFCSLADGVVLRRLSPQKSK